MAFIPISTIVDSNVDEFRTLHALRLRKPPSDFFRAMYFLNRSYSFRHLGDFARSSEAISQSLKILPKNAEASYNGHIDFLKQGLYSEGYAAYFLAGRALKVIDRTHFNCPSWDGQQSLASKTLLVATENGFGDVFITLRFFKRLKTRFAVKKLIVRVHLDELSSLISEIPEVDQVLLEKDPEPFADFGISVSLLALYTCKGYEDLPGEAYLQAKPEKLQIWQDKLQHQKTSPHKKLKVGIRWAGNPGFQGDQFRRFDPELLFNAVKLPTLEVFSFQKENTTNLPSHIADLSADLTTWDDTAAALMCMDLVITSCTSIAHLAAALGVETWVCVPIATFHTWAYSPDGIRSPWYQSVRMFKQKNVYYWDDVFERIHLQLSSSLETRVESGANSKFSMQYLPDPPQLPQGRRPILPIERIEFNREYNLALQEKDTERLLSLYKKYPGSIYLNAALCGHFLETGDFQKGYRGFDLIERAISPNIRLLPNSSIPEWDGRASLAGKTIIVASGQGQGADLLVGRLIPKLRSLGASKIIGAVHVFMSDFFAHQQFYDQVLPEGETLRSPADYWVRINSLIYLLNKDFSDLDGRPYVKPSPLRVKIWENRLRPPQDKMLRVGLRFAGNPNFQGNSERLFDPSLLINAVNQEPFQVYSFQKDTDIPNLPSSVIDLSSQLNSWDDTAAALAHMDLVISSCTSVGHLAAAMGKPTWFCVPYEAYHSWRSPLSKEGRSYWYNSARIFRQSKPGDWDSVFASIQKALLKM